MYKSLVRKILFQFDPEKIHHFSFSMIKGMMKVPFVQGITKSVFKIENPNLERELFGLTFKNPVASASPLLWPRLYDFRFGLLLWRD